MEIEFKVPLYLRKCHKPIQLDKLERGKLYPRSKAAEILGIHLRTLFNKIKDKEIEIVEYGPHQTFVTGEELMDYINKNATTRPCN